MLRCKYCKYFEESEEVIIGVKIDGICRRYPRNEVIFHSNEHWCGEFEEKSD